MYRVNTPKGISMTPEEQRKAETEAGWDQRLRRERRCDLIYMIAVYGLLLLMIVIVTGGLTQ